MEQYRTAPSMSPKGKRPKSGNSLPAKETLLLRSVLPVMTPHDDILIEEFLDDANSRVLPTSDIQGLMLDMAEQLIGAVDQNAVMAILLGFFVHQLDFATAQYLEMNRETDQPEILYEQSKTGHEKIMAKPLITLPLFWKATGKIRGAVHLFDQDPGKKVIDNMTIQLVRKAIQLASQALSRTYVLERALTMASSDELTGLMNRRGYYERFESELERARRHQTALTVALVDVDHFKRFNDSHGHLSGDLILKALADVLTQNVRKSDVVCRFGGEEFAILLPDTSIKLAAELLDRLRVAVTQIQPRGLDGELLQVSISIGLAEVNTQPNTTPHSSEISDSLAKADKQLYRAKNQGRNQVCY